MIESLEGEVWKDAVGFEGLYLVSNLGRIYSLPKKNYSKVMHNGIILKTRVNRYVCFTLPPNNCHKVHRWVAKAFVPNPFNKPYVDHIDGDKLNNMADNLRWCTTRENLNYDNVKRNTKTGVKGVIASKYNTYYYSIVFKGTRFQSKNYKTIEETKIAREEHVERLHQIELTELMSNK
jgi:hypothetical protein